MVMLRKIAAWGVVGFAALVVVFFARPMYRQGEPTVAGKTAQDFPTEIGGKPGHLSDLRGKVVVLNFWATWCPPCVEETPSLNELQRRIASRGGMVVGVSEDDDQQAYDEFLKAYQIRFPTFRDTSKQIPAQYGTSMYPDTYVIRRDGKLDRKIVGPQDWTSPEMTAYIDSLLDAK